MLCLEIEYSTLRTDFKGYCQEVGLTADSKRKLISCEKQKRSDLEMQQLIVKERFLSQGGENDSK